MHRKTEGYPEALEEERDRLLEQIANLQGISTGYGDVEAILNTIESNVSALCDIELDLDRNEMIKLNNSISKIVLKLNMFVKELSKKIGLIHNLMDDAQDVVCTAVLS